jgi:hypothetical protein
MNYKLLYLVLTVGILSAVSVLAQQTDKTNQDNRKIRGSRFIPYPNYTGKTYLYDKFLKGEVELSDGTKISNLGLSYSTYRDELIYYNSVASAQIVIDKISLNGFSITDPNGIVRHFCRQYCSEYMRDQCYFEILSEGKISLLAYRKVNLETCNTYYSKSGLAYEPAYNFFLYSKEKGYSPVNLSRNSLLSKFSKLNQKIVRKLLRKSGIVIADEQSFIDAWNLIKEKAIVPNF